MIAIGPADLPVGRLFVDAAVAEARIKQISQLEILAFEYEMNLTPEAQERAKEQGVDLCLKYIPRTVFDRRAIEKGQVQFHDASYIEVKKHVTKYTVAVELTNFAVYFNQDIIENIKASMKAGKSKTVLESGQLVKLTKDRDGGFTREVLTKSWSDWIDYWSVDFDYTSRREVIHELDADGKLNERETGNFIFENEWQSFRTRKNRELELRSVARPYQRGTYTIAVKVVDIFGNDTMKTIEVKV